MPEFTPDFNPSHLARCESTDCATVTPVNELVSLSDQFELVAGEVVPAGWCSKCSSLAYLLDTDEGLQEGVDIERFDYNGDVYSVIEKKGTSIRFMVDGSFLAQDVGSLYDPYTGKRLIGEDVDPDFEAKALRHG